MSQQESLADHAVRVLAKLATMNDDVTNDDADRHALRNIKRIATQHLDAALREAEELMYLAEGVRELRSPAQ
ncbi:MAG: hypothetical protein EOP39_15775 [Rubrivivax sp.]|nr:MAG: hypothetical protein EOP39_15775 [Rubrivivax sp.]